MRLREAMSKKSSHGTFRNPRREEFEGGSSGVGFRILTGLIGIVVMVALIAIATSLIRQRREIFDLKRALASGAGSGGDPGSSNAEIAALRADLAAISRKLNENQGAENAAAEDRLVIKEALARVLLQHEVGTSELSPLIAGLGEEEQKSFMAKLGEGDPAAGHGALREAIVAQRGNGDGSAGAEEEDLPPLPGTPNSLTPLQPEGEGETTPEPESGPEPAPTPGPAPTPSPAPSPAPTPTPTPGTENDPPPAPAPAPGPPGKFKNYIVVSGDNLYKIARKQGVTSDAIIKANGLADPNKIKVGDILRIPIED